MVSPTFHTCIFRTGHKIIGELLPITATIPSVDDDDDVVVDQPPADAMSEDLPAVRTTNKGKKRKAQLEDESE